MKIGVALILLVAGCGVGCGGRALDQSSEPPATRDASTREASAADAPPRHDASSTDLTAPDAGIPEFDGPLTPWDASTTECVADNLIDHDSFDVIAAAVLACLAGDAALTCEKGTDSLTLTGLAEGVAPVTFEYGTAPDGTHLLAAKGTLVPGMPMIVFRASGVPAAVTFDEALLAFFSTATPAPFSCMWK
jgi:hypothetical protein